MSYSAVYCRQLLVDNYRSKGDIHCAKGDTHCAKGDTHCAKGDTHMLKETPAVLSSGICQRHARKPKSTMEEKWKNGSYQKAHHLCAISVPGAVLHILGISQFFGYNEMTTGLLHYALQHYITPKNDEN